MEATLENAVTIALVGFSIVFLCLVTFAIVIYLINKTDVLLTERKQKKLQLATASKDGGISVQDGIEQDIIPVIVAAACSALEQKVIVKTIRFVSEKSSKDSDWARISRASAISTHNIRRRRGS